MQIRRIRRKDQRQGERNEQALYPLPYDDVLDGRIDCAITASIDGSDEYYETLEALDTPSHVSGRVTAELEMALHRKFESAKMHRPSVKLPFQNQTTDHYEIVLDTHGTLLWPKAKDLEDPLLTVVSEQRRKDYLDDLDSKIFLDCLRKDRIHLPRVCEILKDEFHVGRMAVVGGGTINGAFLDAGLLDEVSILLGPAIDGHNGMRAVFDGLPMDRKTFKLHLDHVQSYPDGAIWLRYTFR